MRDAFFTDPWRSTLRVSAAFVVAFMLAFGLGTATQDAPAGASDCETLDITLAHGPPGAEHREVWVMWPAVWQSPKHAYVDVFHREVGSPQWTTLTDAAWFESG